MDKFVRIFSIGFLTLIGLVFFVATIRGAPGNLENPKTFGKLVLPGGPFESSHERAPYAEMLAIKNRGTIELGKDLGYFAAPDVGSEYGKYYSFFPSGVPVVLLLGYKLAEPYNLGQVGAYFTMSIVTILTMIFMYLICRDALKLPSWAALTAPLTYAFATPAWSYSIAIYQHAFAALLTMSMFYFTWKYRQKDKFNLLWAALAWSIYGWSLFFDYPNLIILMPVVLYLVFSSFTVMKYNAGRMLSFTLNSAVVVTVIFFFAAVGYLAHHNTKYFGSWNVIANTLPRYTPGSKQPERVIAVDKRHEQLGRALQEELMPRGVNILLFGIDKGLFIYSPVMLIALLGYLELWKKKRTMEMGVLAALPLFNLFVYSSFGDPYGGWAFGPRYLVPAMASLSIMSVIGINSKPWRLVRKLVFFLLLIASSGIAVAGALTSNLIPPKVEADFLKVPYYNFVRNFDLIYQNKSASFIYNTYAQPMVSLEQYAVALWAILVVTIFILVFLIPIKQHD